MRSKTPPTRRKEETMIVFLNNKAVGGEEWGRRSYTSTGRRKGTGKIWTPSLQEQ